MLSSIEFIITTRRGGVRLRWTRVDGGGIKPECRVEAPQATVSEGLYQSPYVAARAGVESVNLMKKCVYSTKYLINT